MIRQFFLLGAITFGAAAMAATPTEVTAIDLASDADGTSVSLGLSALVAQKVFTLARPARVVVDLPRTAVRRGVHVPAAAGIVTAIRTGARQDGSLRVVIELNSALPAAQA